MPFSWDNMPYTNFHELNLDWFIKKFNEIFTEWESLYTTLTQWKDATDEDLAQWKRDTLADMDAWENDLLDALDTWKRETGEDIGDWETGVIGDLNDWKQNFLDAYDIMYNRVDAIVSETEYMVENLAEPFSTSKNYAEGDYVVYNGILYTFITDHSAGAWNADHVTQTTAMNDIREIQTLTDPIYNKSEITTVRGSIVNGVEDGSTIYVRSGYIEYNENDILELVNSSGSSLVVTIFYYTFNGERYYTNTSENLALVPNGQTGRKIFSGSGWYRFRCCLASEAPITPADLPNTFYKYNVTITKNTEDIAFQNESDNNLSNIITSKEIVYDYTWNYGVPNPDNGTINNIATRICTNYIRVNDFVSSFTLDVTDGYKAAYYAYNAKKEYIEGYYWFTGKTEIRKKSTWKYIILALSKTDNTETDTSIGNNLTVVWNVEYLGTEMTFEQGSIYNGQEYVNSKYVRTAGFWKVPYKGKFVLKAGTNQLVYRVFYYSLDNVNYWESASENIVVNANTQTVFENEKTAYIRIMIGKGNETDLTPDDVAGFVQYFPDEVKILSLDVAENGLIGPYIPNEDGQTLDDIMEYCSEFTDGTADSYIFFTDPHIMGTSGEFSDLVVTKYMSIIGKYYAESPANFVVCGGDWLNSGDTAAEGKEKIGYVNGMCHNIFGDNFINIVGNHDTNYFGTGASHTLNAKTIANLFNGREGKNYFKYKTPNTNYYILDTEQAENDTSMNSYRWEQIAWLANALIEEDPDHGVLMFHIFYLTNIESEKMVFSTTLDSLITAYNGHTTVTLNGVTYNFTGCSGKIIYCLVGHSHADFVDTIGGVPVIGSLNMQANNIPTFDMVFVDYTNMIFHAKRVGSGSSRNINLTNGQLIT